MESVGSELPASADCFLLIAKLSTSSIKTQTKFPASLASVLMWSNNFWTDLEDSEKKRENSWFEWTVKQMRRSYWSWGDGEAEFVFGDWFDDLLKCSRGWFWRKYNLVDNLNTKALASVVLPSKSIS